jgi:hypothetical protein
MSGGKSMYCISWIDSEDKLHELRNLCEHKKEIILNALNDAAVQGKVSYLTILCIKEKK